MPDNITPCVHHDHLAVMVKEVRDCLLGNPSDPQDTGLRGIMQDTRERLDKHDMFFVWIGRTLATVGGVLFTAAIGMSVAALSNGCEKQDRQTYYGRPTATPAVTDTTRSVTQ